MSMKNLLTPAGIEPATFRFVAQHLNHCATAVPSKRVEDSIIETDKGNKMCIMLVIFAYTNVSCSKIVLL